MNHQNDSGQTSLLGIEYAEIVPPSAITALIAAEREWLQNANECYDVDAWEVWAMDIVPRLATNALEDVDLEDLQRYAPEFLTALTKNKNAPALTKPALRSALAEIFTQ